MSEHFNMQFEKTGNPAFEQFYLTTKSKPNNNRPYSYNWSIGLVLFGKANIVPPAVAYK